VSKLKAHHTLDSEFKRVANDEGVPMEELVAEVAGLTKKSERQIYNFRSGKWPIPDCLYPILCKRFRSRALANALLDDCGETPVKVPDSYELPVLASKTIREDLEYYAEFLADFESDGIDPGELKHLRELAERVVRNVYGFVEIAAEDCERRQLQRASKG
jgi:hypothetical protein